MRYFAMAAIVTTAVMVGGIATGCSPKTTDSETANSRGGGSTAKSVPIGGPGTSADTQAQIQAAEKASATDRAAHAAPPTRQ